jgi:ABC-type polysaccharide/polyol phosphate export permease
VLGWAWSLLQPLATLLVFAAVFSLVFRVQAPPLGADLDRTNFAAFLFTGMVTWNLFSSFVLLSMSQLKSSGELLRKVQFPAWAPILGASMVQLVQVALEVLVLIGMFLWLGNVGITWLLAIPILLATALFAQGIGLMLSMANARFGDVQYIVTVVLGALYFLTPILYPMSLVEDTAEWLAVIVQANPMTWFVTAMHDVMYSLTAPEWWVTPGLLLVGVLIFWLGFVVFERSSEDIGELL